jgi:hypothetical protein
MPEHRRELVDEAKSLGGKVDALGEGITQLSVGVDQLAQRTSRAERVVALVVIGMALVLILAVATGWSLLQQSTINDGLQKAIGRESQTREEGLCPLYSVIIGAYNPNSRPAGPARDTYNQWFDTMRAAYASLDCKQPIVPPAAPR